MTVVEQIEQICKPIVEAKGAYIVELSIRVQGRNRIVEAFVDTDSGITTDLCTDISRELSTALDAANFIHGSYHLVVSSPGLDRPLKYPRQYSKNIGRTLTVKVINNGETQKIQGRLIEATEQGIRLGLTNDEQCIVTFDQIVEARVNTAW